MSDTKRPLTAEEVRALLLELAAYPDGVAAALRVLGVKGHRKHCAMCPVADYLRQHGLFMWVERSHVAIGSILSRKYVPMPDAVRRFVMAFDRGEYPDMEAA